MLIINMVVVVMAIEINLIVTLNEYIDICSELHIVVTFVYYDYHAFINE